MEIGQPGNLQLGRPSSSLSSSVPTYVNNAQQYLNNYRNPLGLAYYQQVLQNLQNTVPQQLSNLGSLPGNIANIFGTENRLVASGNASPYLPAATEAMIGTPLATGTAGGSLLAGGTLTRLAEQLGLFGAANAGFGALQGQTSGPQIAQNLVTGGLTGAYTAPLFLGNPLLSLVKAGAPTSTALQTAAGFAQGAENFASVFMINTALQALSQGRQPTQAELQNAAFLGSVYGTVIAGAPFAGKVGGPMLTKLGIPQSLSELGAQSATRYFSLSY